MATYVITHEVDDVEHWLSSPKREEVFGPMGITVRTFRDPDGSNKTALIAEIPDMEAFQEVMKSEAAADAMKHDGVNPETLLISARPSSDRHSGASAAECRFETNGAAPRSLASSTLCDGPPRTRSRGEPAAPRRAIQAR